MKTPPAPSPGAPQTTDAGISDLHPDLRRLKAVEKFIGLSGDFVEVTDKFRVHKAVNLGLLDMGLDRSSMILIFDEYSHQTADRGRKRETNVVQLLLPPKINIIGTAGALGEAEEEKVGAIKRFIGWIRGTSSKEGGGGN